MKKLLFFLLISMVANAQTNRFIYEYKVKKAGEYQSMYMVLDVNPSETKFYDSKFLESDSLTRETPGHTFINSSVSGQVLMRPLNSFENTAFHANNAGDYFALKSTDPIPWKLLPDTKTKDGYKLQKASADFGGRKWEAWFAPEIPVSEGPYKFRGLPGLIFEVADTGKNFIYTLVKNRKLPETFDTSNFVETYFGTKPVPVSDKQLHKIMLDDYSDPVASLTKILKQGGKINMNGEDITSVTQLDQRRKAIQQSIRKYYNPIELDKAIKYPEK